MLASAIVIDRIAAILVAAGTVAGASVFTSRTWPLAESELPAITVLADDEQIQANGFEWPWVQAHTLSVRVAGHLRASADLDDAMHTLAEQVLGALFASAPTARLEPLNAAETLELNFVSPTPVYRTEQIAGVAMSCTGIERQLLTEGPADIGQITVSLSVQFHTLANNPSEIL